MSLRNGFGAAPGAENLRAMTANLAGPGTVNRGPPGRGRPILKLG
jgi:hypothetical protein